MEGRIQIPDQAPVMILDRCNFFPGTPLPLHIFEHRYREMLAEALEGGRMFCLGTRIAPGLEHLPICPTAGIFRHGTLGLVRACVQQEDGTSNLILEGLSRVQFAEWTQEGPFRIARLEPVDSDLEDQQLVKEGSARVVGLAKRLIAQGVRTPSDFDLTQVGEVDPHLMGDFVANYLVSEFGIRQTLLAIPSLLDRLDLLARAMTAQLEAMGTVEPEN
ncbi:MAG: LON peptidase substrate-binding domain-containing protein [Verrucomicrobiota bacterium]